MVEAGSTVGIEYTLTLEDGTKVEGNVAGEALRFEEGYGPVDPAAFEEVPLGELPEDARKPGTPLTARDGQGRTRHLRVHKVEEDTATLDFNHPLAGKTLKILEIR